MLIVEVVVWIGLTRGLMDGFGAFLWAGTKVSFTRILTRILVTGGVHRKPLGKSDSVKNLRRFNLPSSRERSCRTSRGTKQRCRRLETHE